METGVNNWWCNPDNSRQVCLTSTDTHAEAALEALIVFRRVPISKEFTCLGHLNDYLARHQPPNAF